MLALDERAIGQRLDKALVDAFAEAGLAGLTRSRLARAFAAGGVTIAGKPAKPGMKVERPTPVEVVLQPTPPLAHARPEPIPLTIVHEDAAVLIVDKPAGMVVHAGPGHPDGTLVNAVLHHLGVSADALPTLPGNGPERPGIVHRLDRDTSGLLAIAKTLAAQEALARQFRDHTIDRAYLGIVLGVPTFEVRRIETTHGRDPDDRRRFSPEHGHRRAVTTMTLVRPLARDHAALVRFTLETGRTHQIRMHARHVGHPILGDATYGRRPRDPDLRGRADALGRHALHAAVLGFDHPDPSRGRVRFEASLPSELADLLS